MWKPLMVMMVLGFLSRAPEAAIHSWSGTWRDAGAKDPSSELRTIDHGDGDVEFQLELWGGPPAYNSGGIEGHLSTKDGKATFETREFDGVCRIDFSFTGRQVVIHQTKGSPADCGFGHSILADGTFKRVSSKVPKFIRR